MDYYFYIIYSPKLKKYHVGSTADLKDSLLWHNEGHSKFTKSGTPWEVVHTETFITRVSAFQREVEVKKLKSKKLIEEIVYGPGGAPKPPTSKKSTASKKSTTPRKKKK